MRICVALLVATLFLINVGCGPVLQPAVQGEWSNVHSDKDKISQNARPEAEKPAGEK
jgi:hypothetical protein